MKNDSSSERKSDRMKANPRDIIKDLEEICGVLELEYLKGNHMQFKSKIKKYKKRTSHKVLDAVLGLSSFIREVEGLKEESGTPGPCRAAIHITIAKFILKDAARHN
ncbi:unnamed protein product [Blepharisma stoltei]|uniref:Uncharacterized protein n=1 Tax=Blepharisma stoltei TaxID=1481888 RepID=A0AAU9K1T2_9CILI|nr:unnamed protein product [Blepharisma stoltei]